MGQLQSDLEKLKTCTCEQGVRAWLEEWIPEFATQLSWRVFGIKMGIILVLTGILIFADFTEKQLFETGSTVNVGTALAVVIFSLLTAFLVASFTPYMYKAAPLWAIITVTAFMAVLAGYLLIETIVFPDDKLLYTFFNTDENAFDVWTIVHTLAGVVLGFMMPHWWMLGVIVGWEILEAETKGLGDGEEFVNHFVDIVVAYVGWWVWVLIFLRDDIPWISAKKPDEPCFWCEKFDECCGIEDDKAHAQHAMDATL